MRFVLLAAAFAFASPAIAGPISKWDQRAPDATFTSGGAIGDIERCLIDMNGIGGIPHVFGQEDRPGQRMIVWQNDDMDTTARIDLRATQSGTLITIWKANKKNGAAVKACLPELPG